MILQFSSALCVQPSTETVKQLPSFQIVFGGKIEWFDHFNLKAMLKTMHRSSKDQNFEHFWFPNVHTLARIKIGGKRVLCTEIRFSPSIWLLHKNYHPFAHFRY